MEFEYVTCCYNDDAGFQVSNGGANNKFYHCTSHHNADAKGENADGFVVKLHSGEGNYFENCIAEYNSDDNYNWPLTGTPSALGYKVTFGVAVIQDCTSKNGSNNTKGATLKGTSVGF